MQLLKDKEISSILQKHGLKQNNPDNADDPIVAALKDVFNRGVNAGVARQTVDSVKTIRRLQREIDQAKLLLRTAKERG